MYKKSLLFILLMALFAPLATMAQDKANTDIQWNFRSSFSASTGRQHAIAFDGENIYTAAWSKSESVLSMFYKYDIDGNLIEEFDVPVGDTIDSDRYMRDMTYDGQYFYGCDYHTNRIWCYDLHNKILMGYIQTSLVYANNLGKELGICCYDPQYDAFWVGERATGNTPNLHLDLYLVNRNGEVIKTATPANLGGHTVHGVGYFTDEDNVNWLLLFAVEGFTAHVFKYNIEEDQLYTPYIFDFESTPGWGYACSAGGADVATYEGSSIFFGDVDKSPNLIGLYVLDDYTPVTPVVPEGDIFFDFNDGIISWNTIDADGDGYNWEIRTNWDDQSNPKSLTSRSVAPYTEDPLFPNNFLVTPYKLDCEEISFIANVQDISHPAEHLSVAVSTVSGTNPEDFEIIWETTMTAKGAGGWKYFDVDLRAYQGEEIYVAIIHNECSDQFMVNIDDITLYRTYNGVAEANINTVSIHPNPTTDRVLVESEHVVDSYELYDITGALLLRREVGSTNFDVDVRNLAAGTYVIKMNAESFVQTKRIVKK